MTKIVSILAAVLLLGSTAASAAQNQPLSPEDSRLVSQLSVVKGSSFTQDDMARVFTIARWCVTHPSTGHQSRIADLVSCTQTMIDDQSRGHPGLKGVMVSANYHQ